MLRGFLPQAYNPPLHYVIVKLKVCLEKKITDLQILTLTIIESDTQIQISKVFYYSILWIYIKGSTYLSHMLSHIESSATVIVTPGVSRMNLDMYECSIEVSFNVTVVSTTFQQRDDGL